MSREIFYILHEEGMNLTQFGFSGSYPCKEVDFMGHYTYKKEIFVDNANAGPFPWQWLGGSFVRLIKLTLISNCTDLIISTCMLIYYYVHLCNILILLRWQT